MVGELRGRPAEMSVRAQHGRWGIWDTAVVLDADGDVGVAD